MANIALVSAKDVVVDVDLPPLLAALRKCGVEATRACWDDSDVPWSAFDLVVLRSPWNYVDRYEEFLAWLRETETSVRVLNPSSVVRWNTDKHYLRDLQSHGLAVVPTDFVEVGTPRHAWPALGPDVVVKPVVGAGSRDAARHSSAENAYLHLSRLLADGRAVLVQPYMSEIDIQGETGLVYFNGEFSHAFRKSAILTRDAPPTSELFAPEEISPRDPNRAELELANNAIAACAGDLLYARVDIVPGQHGAPLISELELTEPSFFLDMAPGSAGRLAKAVVERLDHG